MYNKSVGRAVNYGQSFVPGKDQPSQRPSNGFYDYQVQQYGQQSQGGQQPVLYGQPDDDEEMMQTHQAGQTGGVKPPQQPPVQSAQPPFMPNGIPMAQPAPPPAPPVAPPQPQPAPQPQPQPQQSQPQPVMPTFNSPEEEAAFYGQLQQGQAVQGAPGMQWIHNGSGWTQQAAGTSQAQPNGQPPPRQPGSVNAEGVYQPGTPVDPFQAPDTSGIDTRQQELIMQLLANPGSMNDKVISQLKGREKDAAMSMARQLQSSMSDALGSRGLSGGVADKLQRSIMGDATRGLLGAYRDIDINAVGQNRADLLNALGVADDYQNSSIGRALSKQQGMLATEGFNRDGLLAQSNSLMNAIRNRQTDRQLAMQGSQFDQQFGFDREKWQYGVDQDARDRETAAANASAAQDRWEEEQLMQLYNSQFGNEDQLWQWLTGGGW